MLRLRGRSPIRHLTIQDNRQRVDRVNHTRTHRLFTTLLLGGTLICLPSFGSAQTNRELIVEVERGVRLAGTLSLPAGPGPHPAALLVSGSGPQDRDQSVAGMKPFALIADILRAEGIATLRLDDPGVGGSTGDWMSSTLSDLELDLTTALRALRDQPEIDPAMVGLIGHSEGGVTAALVAARDHRLAFLVLLASPVAPIREVLMAQTEAALRASGSDDPEIARHHALQRKTFRAIETGEGWAEVRTLTEEVTRDAVLTLPEQRRAAMGDIDAVVTAQVEQQMAISNMLWFRSLISVDPRASLKGVDAPILGVFGELDVQVSPQLNLDALHATLTEVSHPDFDTVVIGGANHLFQTAGTGHPSEYAMLPPRFAPELVDRLTTWLTARVHGRR